MQTLLLTTHQGLPVSGYTTLRITVGYAIGYGVDVGLHDTQRFPIITPIRRQRQRRARSNV